MRRRKLLRLLSGSALLCSLNGPIAAPAVGQDNSQKAQAKPNIVFMLADDLGWRDLGCYGSTFYDTPHLNQLARDGALFTQAYAACPVCSPTRASLLTGQYPQRSGVTDYIGAAQPDKWNRNTKLLPASYAGELAPEKVTLAELLKTQGYATAFFGKWHLGPEGRWPEDQGFEINKGGIDKGGPYGGNKYFSPYGNPRLSDGPPGEHLPDRLANEVGHFMQANKTKPFLAYFSFYSVHTPLMARDDLQRKYETRRQERNLETKWGREEPRNVRLTQDHAIYAGMVEAMDQATGKVLAKLDELGLAENTIVIFTSDNGGLSTSEGSPTSNQPLRAGKGWLYEGGIRVPFLMRWPGVTKAKSQIDVPVSSPDFLATFLKASGTPLPQDQPLDGIDLKPILQGAKAPERALFWHYPHYGNQGSAPGAAIRRGDWKLIEWFEDNSVELFNLANDGSEKQNLATQEKERVQTLRAQLHDWQKQVGAKMPMPNPKYDATKPNGRKAAQQN